MLPARFAPLADLARRRVGLPSRLCGLGVAAVGLLAGASALAQDSGTAAATAGPGRSPFLPAGWEQRAQTTAPAQSGAAAADAANQYVFNGMITVGSRTLYSISNTQTQQSVLVEMGNSSQGIHVTGYDAARNVVTLNSSGGRSEELTLRKSDGEPLVAATAAGNQRQGAAAAQRMSPADRAAMARAGGNAQSGPPTEWLEARYRRLGEQLERRRAEESTGTSGGGGAVVAGGNNSAGSGSGAGNAGNASGTNAGQAGFNSGAGQSGQENTVRRRRLRLDMNQQ